MAELNRQALDAARKAFHTDYVKRSHQTGSNLPSFDVDVTGRYVNGFLEADFMHFARGYWYFEPDYALAEARKIIEGAKR